MYASKFNSSLGIGADDAFIFVKIWQCVLEEQLRKSCPSSPQSLPVADAEYTNTLKTLMASTLRHSAVSMFVTTITTAGAFYSSSVSSITAIRCFGFVS